MKRFLPHISLSLVALLLLGACSHKGIYTKGYYRRGDVSKQPVVPLKKGSDYYVVQKGETLYSIAWQHGYDHRQLAFWNGIKAPYTIFPLQRIRVTPRKIKPKPKPVLSSRERKQTPPSKKKPQPVYAPKKHAWKKLVWSWPTTGRIITTFSHNDAGRKGVDISGRLGQPVKAAGAGKVVYSGNGLRGYGNLIIVKHNEEFFSAYAHNKKNLVKENQIVKARQQIADMGKSGTNRVKLHFEIRRSGKPVNPLRYLPKHRK